MKNLPKSFFVILSLFIFASIAHCEATNPVQVYNNIDSEISMRPWSTKGLGKVVSHEKLSVIKTKSSKGQIVILKWNTAMDAFDTEVYKSEDNASNPDTWQITNSKLDKTLTFQHGEFYMIQHTIAGPDGGIMSQIFKLP